MWWWVCSAYAEWGSGGVIVSQGAGRGAGVVARRGGSAQPLYDAIPGAAPWPRQQVFRASSATMRLLRRQRSVRRAHERRKRRESVWNVEGRGGFVGRGGDAEGRRSLTLLRAACASLRGSTDTSQWRVGSLGALSRSRASFSLAAALVPCAIRTTRYDHRGIAACAGVRVYCVLGVYTVHCSLCTVGIAPVRRVAVAAAWPVAPAPSAPEREGALCTGGG